MSSSPPDPGPEGHGSLGTTGIRWFSEPQVQVAMAHARRGGIALHHFRYDLRRFGLGPRAAACHILSADRSRLVAFVAPFGLPESLIQAPKPHRPHVWHFDAFGFVLERLTAIHPLPPGVDEQVERS